MMVQSPLSENPCPCPRDHKFGIVGHLRFLGVKSLVLDENGGGCRREWRCGEDRLHPRRWRGHCNLEAGEVHKEGLKTLRMGWRRSAADSPAVL